MSSSNRPEGVRVGQHDAGDVLVEHLPQGGHVDAAPGVAGHGDHLVAAEGHRRRVGAVGRVGDDHLGADRTLGLVPRPHEQQPGELPRRPGRRLERGRGHAGDLAEDRLQLDQQGQPSLGREAGAAGWTPARPGSAATASQTFGLYFMVHDPSG